jgi:hypothetical protein
MTKSRSAEKKEFKAVQTEHLIEYAKTRAAVLELRERASILGITLELASRWRPDPIAEEGLQLIELTAAALDRIKELEGNGRSGSQD